MMGAIYLALMLHMQHALPAAGEQPVRLPQSADIQVALVMDWIMRSSSGFHLHDYAVRNLKCAPVPLEKQEPVPQVQDKFKLFEDVPLAKVHCNFEYAAYPNKDLKRKKRGTKIVARQLSERALRKISEAQWRSRDTAVYLMSRDVCRLMSRTPEPGECDPYWMIDKRTVPAVF
jgi:hypothetical protein